MKPLSNREKRLISNALRTAFDGKGQVTSEQLERFIFRAMNYDRRDTAEHVMSKLANIIAAILTSEKDLGRAVHPDALVMITLFTSMIVPRFRDVSKGLSEMVIQASGVSFEKEINDKRKTFVEKYQFDKDVYESVTGTLIDMLDDLRKEDSESFDKEKADVAQRAKDAGFKRVDGDTIPDDVRDALNKMGIDVNKLHVIDLNEGDDEKPSTH